ncbi:MAG: hypothetical protein ACPHO8_19110, partial [Mariniblastus sp.]
RIRMGQPLTVYHCHTPSPLDTSQPSTQHQPPKPSTRYKPNMSLLTLPVLCQTDKPSKLEALRAASPPLNLCPACICSRFIVGHTR